MTTRIKKLILVAILLALWIPATSHAESLYVLSFGERLACQERLEEVYWQHRIWPETNSGPKPSLTEVLSHDVLSRKVEDALRLTRSLEELWHWTIDGAQLQAEEAPVGIDAGEQ